MPLCKHCGSHIKQYETYLLGKSVKWWALGVDSGEDECDAVGGEKHEPQRHVVYFEWDKRLKLSSIDILDVVVKSIDPASTVVGGGDVTHEGKSVARFMRIMFSDEDKAAQFMKRLPPEKNFRSLFMTPVEELGENEPHD